MRTRAPVFALLTLLSAAPALSGERLQITEASWKEGAAELRVEGRSDRIDDVVLLRDADSKKLIGSAAVRGDGKWVLKVKNPAAVPARLRASCGKDSKECSVGNGAQR